MFSVDNARFPAAKLQNPHPRLGHYTARIIHGNHPGKLNEYFPVQANLRAEIFADSGTGFSEVRSYCRQMDCDIQDNVPVNCLFRVDGFMVRSIASYIALSRSFSAAGVLCTACSSYRYRLMISSFYGVCKDMFQPVHQQTQATSR